MSHCSTNRKKNAAKPLRLALGACVIQVEYGYTDEETVQENPYLQCFCGYPGYDDEHLPFDSSTMVYFRKRLTSEVLGEINEVFLNTVRQSKKQDADEDDPGSGGNRGTIIVNATCVLSNIRYPQDASLLNQARENTEKLLESFMIRQMAGALYLSQESPQSFSSVQPQSQEECKKARKAVGQQLHYLKRNLATIDEKMFWDEL